MLTLTSPEFHRRLNVLRATDNVTNWYYLAREYLFLALTLAAAVAFFELREGWGLAWAWNVPVALIAAVLVGAGQHRLSTLTHEASHYLLFRNRLLNDLVSDWFCMFPLLSNTHNYRIQHLAHHQFVNDPAKDPDVAQLEASGHRFHFPMAKARFVWECVVKQLLWFPNLIRYVRVRAKYNSTGGGGGPYEAKGPRSPLLALVGVAYLLTQAAALTALVTHGDPVLLAWVPAALLAAVLAFYALVPERFYRHTLIKPAVPPRVMTLLRMLHTTLLFTGLAWLTWWTDRPWGLYYVVLWVVPLLTTFSFFMILRQVVQHGNGDRGRLTNTRIFRVEPFIGFAVFPMGMDYHLPHHLFPLVPHFRIRQLHDLLMEAPEYRDQATQVDGYFLHQEHPPVHPTVLDLMARG